MCRRTFVSLRRVSIAGEYRNQGYKGESDQHPAADTVYCLPVRGRSFQARQSLSAFF